MNRQWGVNIKTWPEFSAALGRLDRLVYPITSPRDAENGKPLPSPPYGHASALSDDGPPGPIVQMNGGLHEERET